MCASYLDFISLVQFSSYLLIPVKAEFSRLNKLAMAVPRLKQSTHLAEKQEKEEAVRLQQLQS